MIIIKTEQQRKRSKVEQRRKIWLKNVSEYFFLFEANANERACCKVIKKANTDKLKI